MTTTSFLQFVKRLAGRCPFTLLGVATLVMFFVVDALPAHIAVLLMPVVRVLVVPMWAGFDAGMLITFPLRQAVAPAGIAATAVGVLALLFGVTPYVIADAVLYAFRHRKPAGP